MDEGGSGAADGTGAPASGLLLGPADIAAMNGMAVARSAAFVRIAGSVLVAIGAVGGLAWLWLTVRAQQALTDRGAVFELPGGEPFESPDPSLPERLDALANGTGLLLTASLVTAVGIVVRLVATYAVARTGGSVTGFQPGDVLPDDPDDPDDGPTP